MRHRAELASPLLLESPVVLAVAAVSVRELESRLIHAFLLSSPTRRTAPSSVAKKSRRLDRAGTPFEGAEFARRARSSWARPAPQTGRHRGHRVRWDERVDLQ